MRWDEVDLAQGLWTIPACRYKTGLDHVVPLSPEVRDILTARHSESASGFVLGSRDDPRKPFNGAASAMRRLRKSVTCNPPFVLHDLRRTVRTGLARIGVDEETAELVLGHVPQGMRKVYDLHERLGERRAALTRWAEYVRAAADGSITVVPFPRARTGGRADGGIVISSSLASG
jgi:integrase